MDSGWLHGHVQFIDQDPHLYTHRIKEAVSTQDFTPITSGIVELKIPEAWMPTVKETTTTGKTTTADC